MEHDCPPPPLPSPPPSRFSLITMSIVNYLPPRFRFEGGHRGRTVGKEPTKFSVNGSARNASEHGGTLSRHRLLVLGLQLSVPLTRKHSSINGNKRASEKALRVVPACCYHVCAINHTTVVQACGIATTPTRMC